MVPFGPDGRQRSLEQFLRPSIRQEQQPQYVPQAALRSTSFCQQLLVAELGWPATRSLNTWRTVQARQNIAQLQLPNVYGSGSIQRQAVLVLELQQQGTSISADSTFAAVGYCCGIMYIIKVSDLLHIASQAHIAESRAAPNSSLQRAAPAAATAAVTHSTMMTVDLQDRLLSCCWAPAGGLHTEMVTAGAQGAKIRRFAEGRHHEYALKLKSGSQLPKPAAVKYLERSAAYQVVAAKAGGLVLWDCRAASRAVAEVPTSSNEQLLQPMPGGTVLLTAAADGQLSLYDVRRISSNASSVVNFGGSRTSQQLIATFNIPARADEAAAAGGGAGTLSQPDNHTAGTTSSSSRPQGSSSSRHVYPYFRDVQLNPSDCNMVAYTRPDLQVGVFDLYSSKVLQQVCVTEDTGAAVPAAATAVVQVSGSLQAPARCCWDPQGRVLYTHGLLRHYNSNTMGAGLMELQPTVAAVDFGSWGGRQHRRDSSCWPTTQQSEQEGNAETTSQEAAESQVQQDHVQDVCASGSTGRAALDSSGFVSGDGVILCQGGQVLHVPLAGHAGPTELAVCGQNGELLLGTLCGGIMCIS